jgi:long-chain acyl-CoA synthetase
MMDYNIGRWLDDNVRKYGEYKQFIYLGPAGEQTWTNKQILEHAKALATGLQNIGIKKGDVLGSVISNIPEIPEIMNGVTRMGGTYLPIIYMLTPAEIRYILQDSACKFVITEDSLLPKVREAASGLDTIQRIIVVGKEKAADIIPYGDLLKDSSKGNVADVDKEDLAILMYTSGTTGFPKGVMLTHNNLECQMKTGYSVWSCNPGDALLTTIPMNHIYGVLSCLEGYFSGFVNILMPPFDPRKVLDALKKYNVKIIPVVPTMLIYMLLVADPKKDDLSFVDLLVSSGGPLAQDLIRQTEEVFKKEITQGYGCTEVGGSVARQRRDWPRKPGSVGFPMPGLALKIVDENDNEVPRGTEGEIICCGPIVTKGYLNKPKETAEAIVNGWLHTGDLGRLDDVGELYITGRKKDLIIKGGENIDPGVAEGWLYKHPAVLECAVIAIPDKKYTEEVGAAVVLKPGVSATEEQLLVYLGENLHHFVAPKRIFFMKSLPKTGLGKILKREIRRMVKELMENEAR